MKTLGWSDRAGKGPRRVSVFQGTPTMTRAERLTAALADLQGLGNCYIYQIRGRKYRRIAKRGW